MKRFAVLFTLLAMLLAPAAHAEWVTVQGHWKISSQGSPTSGTAIYVRDTLYNVIAAGQTDTIGSFSLDEAGLPPRGMAPPAGLTVGVIQASGDFKSDTTTVAWLLFTPDSSAAPTTPTLSALTVLFDGRPAGLGRRSTGDLGSGWVKADSALVNGAAGGTLIVGNESVAVPIRTISPYGSVLRWGNLRARITSATGVLSGGIRVFLRYWKP